MGVCAPYTHNYPDTRNCHYWKKHGQKIVTQQWLQFLLIQVFCTKAYDVLHELPLTTKGKSERSVRS